MKWGQWCSWVLAAIALAGCIPEAYQWSPDGRWMTVLSDAGLQLADQSGKLTSALIQGAQLASWFPDSKRLLASRQIDATDWTELKEYLTPAQAKGVAEVAQQARQAALAANGPPRKDETFGYMANQMMEQYGQAHKDAGFYWGDLDSGLALYMRDHDDGALRKKIPTDEWATMAKTQQTIYSIEVFNLGESGDLSAGSRLMTSLNQPAELRVSPTGRAAIIVIRGPKSDFQDAKPLSLWVVATDGSDSQLRVSENSTWYPDWTPDGHDVVYVEAQFSPCAAPGSDTWLGTLKRMTVVDDNGKMLEKLGGAGSYAGLICNSITRVRCLRDGRIIFSSADVNLPCTPDDIPNRAQLFCLSGDAATATRVLTRQAAERIGDGAQFFEVSPDGHYASIPDLSGKVTVVNLTGGSEVMEVQDQPFPDNLGNNGWRLPSVPSWRNNDELTFVKPGADGAPASIVLHSISKATEQTLSASWPKDILGKLTSSEPATQPSTQPAVIRLRFVPDHDIHAEDVDWSRLSPPPNSHAQGVSWAQIHASVGSWFPVQDADGTELFRVSVDEGNDDRLMVSVSGRHIELPRDKAVTLTVAGKSYLLEYASVYVAPSARSTTNKAFILVARVPVLGD